MGAFAAIIDQAHLNMCGIAGLMKPSAQCSLDIQNISLRMARRLAHRGPDDEGVWIDQSCGVGLSHMRLSILDLSAAGHQPMTSFCGRYVIVFNGEIYNHLELRKALDADMLSQNGFRWRGQSDTETLLSAISAWGFEQAMSKTVGMFAFALWDRDEKSIRLARDRLGEKPLYYGLQDGALIFASELKALHAYPGFQSEIDRDALAMFLRRNTVPAPYSIYRGIYKLPPGTWIKLKQDDIASGQLPGPIPYWSICEVAIKGQNNCFDGSTEEATIKLEQLLKQSVTGQMLADVPLGAFLSGGIDSSIVVALMQAQSSKPVHTFTIGFDESNYNEADHALAVASYLGTEHTEFVVTPKEAMDVIPSLPILYDEPFADVSQIPTCMVSRLASQHVSVCLSGDGGDELFGGYNRYVGGMKLWRKLAYLPIGIRKKIGSVMVRIPPSLWDAVFDRLGGLLPRNWRFQTPGDKLHKLADILSFQSVDEIYYKLVSNWSDSEQLVIGRSVPIPAFNQERCFSQLAEPEHQMMGLDTQTYLPDDILMKVDRAAMGVSLETRVPMLDHRVVEFAWTLPMEMKIQGYRGKWLLRRVLDRHVPATLIERTKSGFAVPIDSWLRGPLKDWAEDLLNADTLKRQGYIDPALIHLKWEEHQTGKHNWSNRLWAVLMFQSWVNQNH